jgi:hypothetical protein
LKWFENKSVTDGKKEMASCQTLNIGWERLAFGFELLNLLKSVQCFCGFSVLWYEMNLNTCLRKGDGNKRKEVVY